MAQISNVEILEQETLETGSGVASRQKSQNKVVYAFVKRTADFILSLLASIVLLVPILVIALLIVLKDPGSPIYVHTRVGRDRKPIKIVKLRTMRKGADKLENMLTPEQLEEYHREYKLEDDPRLIGWKKPGDGKRCFGAVIRRLSLDEVPQIFWNVLIRGDMSLVGPRPILQEELEENYTPEEQKALLSVKPGLTGYWQAYARNDAEYAGGGQTEYGTLLRGESRDEARSENTADDSESGAPAHGCKVTRKSFYDFIKRAFDLLVSIICLTVGLPVYLIMILAIVIDDPGNPFYIQKRIGLHGKAFNMVKLRTMYRDADKHKAELKNECVSDVHFKMKNDPRITRVGRFLRATSLDETPQAVNVLLNHMSVVGPRAFVASEQSQLPDDRLQVKPGLTCYWQITDTTQMSYEDQLELDYQYIRERGVWTDIKLIGKTVKAVFKGGNY